MSKPTSIPNNNPVGTSNQRPTPTAKTRFAKIADNAVNDVASGRLNE